MLGPCKHWIGVHHVKAHFIQKRFIQNSILFRQDASLTS